MSQFTGRAIGILLFTAALTTMVSPTTASAAAIVYDTSGLVGTTGIGGTNVIKFVPVSQNSFTAPSTLSLGTFVVSALPDGQTTTYNHTPFAISFAISSVNGFSVASEPKLLTVTGFLNGKVTGSNLSTVIAQFDPVTNPNIVLGPNFSVTLSLPSLQRPLVPSTTLGGQSSAEAFVRPFQNTPEPGVIALFVVVGAGLGLKRLRRKAA